MINEPCWHSETNSKIQYQFVKYFQPGKADSQIANRNFISNDGKDLKNTIINRPVFCGRFSHQFNINPEMRIINPSAYINDLQSCSIVENDFVSCGECF